MVVKAKSLKNILGKEVKIKSESIDNDDYESVTLKLKDAIQSSVHRKESNITELVYYLEELYQMDGLDETEKDIYERYQWGMDIEPSEWLYVYRNAHDLNYEQF